MKGYPLIITSHITMFKKKKKKNFIQTKLLKYTHSKQINVLSGASRAESMITSGTWNE